MLFLKQSLTLPFICHKSATVRQIDSNEVSNSMLKLAFATMYRVSQIKVPTFENSLHQGYFSDLNDSSSN